MSKTLRLILASLVLVPSVIHAQESLEVIKTPSVGPLPKATNPATSSQCPAITDYPTPTQTDRATFCTLQTQRGTSVDIDIGTIRKFCSGKDGCTVRLAMHNWDNTGRIASREFLFFYNDQNKNWRSSNDAAGTKENNVIEHVYQAWACYFTDGRYSNWQGTGDSDLNFGLLSWNQYNADCIITFIR